MNKQCLVCKKKFSKEQMYYKERKYCNHICYAEMKRIRGDRVNWTEEMRANFSRRQKGSANPAWKGGLTKGRTKELNTIQYKRFKELLLKRDNYKCVTCKSKEKLQIDHVKPWKLYAELRFDPSNAQILCAPCHYKKSSEEGKRYWVNQYTKSEYFQ